MAIQLRQILLPCHSMPLLSKPHLPREFLADLIAEPFMRDKKSFIFSKQFHLFRFKLADQQQTEIAASSDISGFSGGFFQFADQDKRANLDSTQLSSPASELYKQYSSFMWR
jgi:hypothetical protein